jgi:SNF2 family DNA or RNA helicase
MRFVMGNSIEERIIQLQRKKKELVEGALSGAQFNSDMGQLSLLDLQTLFQKGT